MIKRDDLINRHARADTRARTQPDPVVILLAKRGAAGAASRHHVLNAAPFFQQFVSIWGHGRCNYHIMRPSDSELSDQSLGASDNSE